MKEKYRCVWPKDDPLMKTYHDQEWGVPLHEDQKLFEFMILDAFQAGLSWQTILRKRENFRKAFADFDIRKVSRFKEDKVQKLLQDAGIIRNQLKIRSTIQNANAFLKVQEEFETFDKYIWQFVSYQPKINQWNSVKEIPPSSPESDTMSKDLKKRGFKFVGTTICYAFMQASGMINDHEVRCFRHQEV
ncbi:MAG: DNA-3-methyladenine glycosylase I [Planctomycetota bacterium]